MNLSDNIKKIRKENNLSQEQLADKLNVSRQSVSKWESGQAYPEMDKVLQICQLFNLNIDELMNQDIKEVNNRKQEKSNLNKYFDDFFNYVTKTIDMFGSMNFKSKLKCLFEQLIILGVICIILVIFGSIAEGIFSRLFNSIPWEIYSVIYDVFASLYLICAVIITVMLMVHIFKVRYLDYYVIVNDLSNDDVKNSSLEDIKDSDNRNIKDNNNQNERIFFSKKSQNIVIRDPEHSGYKFMSGLFNIVLFIIKLCVWFILAFFAFTLVCLSVSFALSFMIIRSGLLFVGLLIIIISALIINIIIILKLYYFIINRKSKRMRFAVMFLISLITCGIGIGFLLQGLSQFNYYCGYESDDRKLNSYEFDMNDNFFIDSWYNNDFEFIESENENIKIEVIASKYFDIHVQNSNNIIYINYYENNIMEILRAYVDDINNKKIVDYSCNKIKVYSTKNNIEQLKKNRYYSYYDY